MNILGINAVYHDSAAALLVDGALVTAVEEERFNRIKHGKLSDVDNPHQLPEQAIRFCLRSAGLRASGSVPSTSSGMPYSANTSRTRSAYGAKSRTVRRMSSAGVP